MKFRILIAEDDPSIQEIFTIILERAGYEVQISPDGRNIFEKGVPHLFILDKQLSGINGLDVCRNLKSDAATRDIPVIMISATPGIEVLAIEAGANDYLEKPFSVRALLEKVEKYLTRELRSA